MNAGPPANCPITFSSRAVFSVTLTEGGIGIFDFAVLDIFLIGFSVFMSKDFGFSVLVFNAVCGFLFFSIWFSVFVKNTSGFSILVAMWFFGFSYFFFLFVLTYLTIQFCMRFSVLADFVCGFAVLGEFFFGFAVSSIPQCPPLLGAATNGSSSV